MKKKFLTLVSLLIGLALMNSACGAKAEATPTTDPNAVMTQIALTVEAEITQSALLTPSATATPAPTNTLPATATQDLAAQTTAIAPTVAAAVPTAGGAATQAVAASTGDDSLVISDVTVPDGSGFDPKVPFTKTWRVRNTGTSTWDTTYSLVNVDGNTWGEEAVVPLTTTVPPGAEVDLSVQVTSPSATGQYISRWFLLNPNGTTFGQEMYMIIIVGAKQVTTTPTIAG